MMLNIPHRKRIFFRKETPAGGTPALQLELAAAQFHYMSILDTVSPIKMR